MSSQRQKSHTKPILSYMATEAEVKGNRAWGRGQGQEEQPSLVSIKSILVTKFGCVEQQFRDFKEQICKIIDAAEKKTEAKLAAITQKIDALGKGHQDFKQTDQLKLQMVDLDKTTSRLEKTFEMLKDN